ncbi:capsule biosynthesis GfcC family protein [Halopseudomonas pachastrellae]|uniref:capsule biosynthesis GfcC family protein n=1 Tax=Halopseudomonas pachastrellae TaxID=254161 RepID=UPI003D7DA01B
MQSKIARLLLLTLASLPLQLFAAPIFSVNGAVAQPGDYQWQPDTRLLDASVTAQVNPDAWYLGATLQRDSAKTAQQKLKVGLLFDLRSAKVRSHLLADDAALALIDRLINQVQSMPVTGRVTAEMNPLKQRLIRYNPLLEPGDKIFYDSRPTTINVTGAVQANCQLAFAYTSSAHEYLQHCPPHPLASADSLYIIQPDGRVQKVGRAYWNQQTLPVAVGATLYVPFSEALLAEVSNIEAFNEDMAAFIATQTPAQERVR